jgi:hypothetical protein
MVVAGALGNPHRIDRDEGGDPLMPLWQRLTITILAMLAASFVVGLIWSALTGYDLPSYLAGVIGGLAALPTWEFLKRVGPGAQAS